MGGRREGGKMIKGLRSSREKVLFVKLKVKYHFEMSLCHKKKVFFPGEKKIKEVG